MYPLLLHMYLIFTNFWASCGIKSGIYDGFIDLKPLLLDFSSSKTYKSTLIMVLIPYILFFSNFWVLRDIKSGIYVVKVVYMMVLSIWSRFYSISRHQKYINWHQSWCYTIYFIFSNFRVSRGIKSGTYVVKVVYIMMVLSIWNRFYSISRHQKHINRHHSWYLSIKLGI